MAIATGDVITLIFCVLLLIFLSCMAYKEGK